MPMRPTATERFYAESIQEMTKTGLPFMIGGTYAVNIYAALDRPTKDLDFFVKAGDYPRFLNHFNGLGYTTGVDDERWLAHARKGRGNAYFDLIFGSENAVTPVQDQWFTNARVTKLFDKQVLVLPPTELIWSKVFIQNRNRYDGNDIAHLILKTGNEVEWNRLLSYMEQYWEVLLFHIINFRFIYPSERETIPRWILDELLDRLHHQIEAPTPKMKACRGRLLSRRDYMIDVQEWGFADLIGGEGKGAVA